MRRSAGGEAGPIARKGLKGYREHSQVVSYFAELAIISRFGACFAAWDFIRVMWYSVIGDDAIRGAFGAKECRRRQGWRNRGYRSHDFQFNIYTTKSKY